MGHNQYKKHKLKYIFYRIGYRLGAWTKYRIGRMLEQDSIYLQKDVGQKDKKTIIPSTAEPMKRPQLRIASGPCGCSFVIYFFGQPESETATIVDFLYMGGILSTFRLCVGVIIIKIIALALVFLQVEFYYTVCIQVVSPSRLCPILAIVFQLYVTSFQLVSMCRIRNISFISCNPILFRVTMQCVLQAQLSCNFFTKTRIVLLPARQPITVCTVAVIWQNS